MTLETVEWLHAAVAATVAPALAAPALAATALGVFLAACVYVSNRRGM